MNVEEDVLKKTSLGTEAVYSVYKEKISELIAYIEVYEHDLKPEIMAQLAELFQAVVTYERDRTSKFEEDSLEVLSDMNLKVLLSLYNHAIWIFIKKIREYKKIFRKFKYKGVRIENENCMFAEVAKQEEQEIAKSYSTNFKKLYRRNFFTVLGELNFGQKIRYICIYLRFLINPSFGSLKHKIILPTDNLSIEQINSVDFEDTYKQVKKLVERYENVSAKVISNGAERSMLESVFIAITSWIIPVGLGAYALVKFFI